MKLEKKQQVVGAFKKRFDATRVLILTDYKGLDVGSINDLRNKLRQAGSEYHVVKNSLLIRASENNSVGLIRDHFKGPSAVALSTQDPVAPAKVLVDFAKANDKLQIKAGVLNGRALSAVDIKALSELPSREELLAQLLGMLQGIPATFVRTLNAIPQQMLNLLQALKEQKETQAA